MALQVQRSSKEVRKSFRRLDDTSLLGRDRGLSSGSSGFSALLLPVPDVPKTDGPVNKDDDYNQVIAEARQCVGHGATEGAFPEEWDAQLLVDCGLTAEGHRLILFCPRFLGPVLHDPAELDRAFRYILLIMDGIATREKYVFVYCYLGMDWSDPKLAHRLRVAYDILPELYSSNLERFYILHPTTGFRVTMWTFWPWLTQHLWDSIEYVQALDELCEKLQPKDPDARAGLRRRFPQMVQRHDAQRIGAELPVTFGVPLSHLCSSFGVDFTDKTTGRWYPRLPPALIFLCEAMEREAADEGFSDLFAADASIVHSVVETVDQGAPLARDLPSSALWCVLKLFLDCLPTPLLSFDFMDELQSQNIGEADTEGHRRLLADALHNRLSTEAAYVTLYVASFLHTMCKNAEEKRTMIQAMMTMKRSDRDLPPPLQAMMTQKRSDKEPLTPALAAKVFSSNFVRPRDVMQESGKWIPVATALVETLIDSAENPELWIGSHVASLHERDSSSDEG